MPRLNPTSAFLPIRLKLTNTQGFYVDFMDERKDETAETLVPPSFLMADGTTFRPAYYSSRHD